MPQYEVSHTYFFRETGQKLEPGETVKLTKEQAAEHNRNNPGLLKPVRVTAQAHPEDVRSKESGEAGPPAKAPRKTASRKPRARR